MSNQKNLLLQQDILNIIGECNKKGMGCSKEKLIAQVCLFRGMSRREPSFIIKSLITIEHVRIEGKDDLFIVDLEKQMEREIEQVEIEGVDNG